MRITADENSSRNFNVVELGRLSGRDGPSLTARLFSVGRRGEVGEEGGCARAGRQPGEHQADGGAAREDGSDQGEEEDQ